ncbi:MAG: hypothetical protein GF331_08975, partial [Chitinivibrionales bacterium]|nr:hypothetical protein [Chitinivibrionales bacterium]
TRVAWIRGGDRLKGGGPVVGFDTQTGAETTILSAAQNQNKPIICSGGYRVVVSIDYQVYVVNWDGSGKRYLTDGICSDVWVDPNTGLEWAIVRKGGDTSDGEVIRYLIEDPNQSVLLWDRTPAGDFYMNWYQTSADGNIAVDFLPWDKVYVIDDGAWTANGFHTLMSAGCWSSLASDNSYVWFNFPNTGFGHTGLAVHRNKETIGELAIDAGPLPSGVTGEYYHPKFASKGGRFLVVTGGYESGGSLDKVEVYLGRFAADYRTFDGWVRVTTNSTGDITPDAWVAVAAPSPSMRFSVDTLAFEADVNGANPAPASVSVTTPYGAFSSLSAASDQPWLTVAASGSGDTYTVTNSVNVSGLASGVHRATVTVTAPDAIPSIRTYRVKLTVRGAPTATAVAVSPATSAVPREGSTQLSATVMDQHEEPMTPQPAVSWSVSGPGADVTVNNGLFVAGTTTGLYTVTASAAGIAGAATVNVVEYIPVDIKLNCGDPTVGYVPGWAGDLEYVVPGYEGNSWRDEWTRSATLDKADVSSPPPDEVYVRFRAGSVHYDFADVPRGTYKVRLHFVEPYANEANRPRSINCTIEGQQLLSSFNIRMTAGGLYTAVVQEFVVNVNDDGLQLNIGGTQAMWNGIEIVSVGSEGKQIAILEPLGGEVYAVGDVVTVRWSAVPTTNGVVIEMSPDGGENLYPIVDSTIAASDPNWGTYHWRVPETVGSGVSTRSNNVVFKVYDYQSPTIYDITVAPVTIGSNAAGAVTNEAVKQWSVSAGAQGVLRVYIPEPGLHTVDLFTLDGRRVRRVAHTAPGRYNLGDNARATSCLIVRVAGEKTAFTRRILPVR